MNERPPHLVPVSDASSGPEAAGAPAAAPGPQPTPRPGGGPRWLPWALALALLVCATGWLLSVQEGRRLEASLEATRVALAEARAELDAYDAHLEAVRNRVDGLAGQLDELRALLAGGPGSAAPADVPSDAPAAQAAPAGDAPVTPLTD